MIGSRPCKFCGGEVTSKVAEVDWCRTCHNHGFHLMERFEDLLNEIGPADATVWNTGGGCYVIEIPVDENTYIWASDEDGTGLPETEEGPWLVMLYDAETGTEGTVLGEALNHEGFMDKIKEYTR